MGTNRMWALAGAVALLGAPAMGAVNYNASKSNTGNVTAQGTHPCKPGEVKGCTPKAAYDLGSGQLVGRRRHQALIVHKPTDTSSPAVAKP